MAVGEDHTFHLFSTSRPPRFFVALGAAMLVHFAVIFWVGFSFIKTKANQSQLELTLARYKDSDPEKADYLAQFNQQGSGSLQEKALPSTTHTADFDTEKIQQTATASPLQNLKRNIAKNRTITTVSVTLNRQVVSDKPSPNSPDNSTSADWSPLPQSIQQEIASLEALLRQEQQIYANRPRIKRLTAISAKKEAGALYKEAWRKKVEKIGNSHYPAQAKINKIYGELGMMVAINRDGSLFDIQITRSSGYPILDKAALKIVKLAAPYPPFDEELSNYDRVELIRTWRFEKNITTISQ